MVKTNTNRQKALCSNRQNTRFLKDFSRCQQDGLDAISISASSGNYWWFEVAGVWSSLSRLSQGKQLFHLTRISTDNSQFTSRGSWEEASGTQREPTQTLGEHERPQVLGGGRKQRQPLRHRVARHGSKLWRKKKKEGRTRFQEAMQP